MRKMKKFIRELMGRMTLEEKLGQLNLLTSGGGVLTGASINTHVDAKIVAGKAGGVFGTDWTREAIRHAQALAVEKSRLGIPLLFGADLIHGFRMPTFPTPLAMSCSWDMKAIETMAHTTALQARAGGVNWNFSPMVDICRDPRWGRVVESAGEDPHLGSKIAEAMVKGYQGGDMAAPDRMMACVKHFFGYGAAEGGRDYNTVDMSPAKAHDVYLPPYRAAVKAGAGSIMSSFNDVNGMPSHCNPDLQTGLLRRKWGFRGMNVADYTGVNELTAHGLGDLKDAAALALKAGLDMDMVGEGFIHTLPVSIADGTVDVSYVDRACARVLEMKYRLGLFDDPYRGMDDANNAAVAAREPEFRKQARDIAAQSCVLLKNDGQVLPLEKSRTIAVIGPLADDRLNMNGSWAPSGDGTRCVTVLEGMRNVAGADARILYARGANITDDPVLADRLNVFDGADKTVVIDPDTESLLVEASATARRADAVVLVVGEAKEHTGESSSVTDLVLSKGQQRLVEAVLLTGKPVALVVISGRPLNLSFEDRNVPAILWAPFLGTEAGNALADLLYGDKTPSGKLTMSFPRSVGQIPVYYAHKNTGRPLSPGKDFVKFQSCYLDEKNTPLYPFGHGLSYTRFKYGPVTVGKTALNGDETLKASVTVTNTGGRAGREITQLYITDPVASRTRPVRELKGFQHTDLAPGESRTISFDITTDMLEFSTAKTLADTSRRWEPGAFVIQIGGSSAHLHSVTVDWRKAAPKRPAAPRL